MSYQVSNPKKEDFRKYLERNGIVDALTRVLVGLYEHPDKPENPLEYIKQYLPGPSDLDVELIKSQNLDLLRQVALLTNQVDHLTKYIAASGISPAPPISDATPEDPSVAAKPATTTS